MSAYRIILVIFGVTMITASLYFISPSVEMSRKSQVIKGFKVMQMMSLVVSLLVLAIGILMIVAAFMTRLTKIVMCVIVP